MARSRGAMHVAKVSRKQTLASGEEREYVSHLLRRSYRDGGKVKHETLANISALPEAAIAALRDSLAGKRLITADEDLEITRSLPHGHVAAIAAQADALDLPGMLGPACRARDLTLALIIARIARPGSKLSTTLWWNDTTLAADLHLAGAGTDEVYSAMDWLAGRQDAIEKQLAVRHLNAAVNPGLRT